MASVALRSSVLKSVDYDVLTRVLVVELQSQKRYTYVAVPLTVYQNLVLATSPGRYFNQHIKGKFQVVAP